VAGEEKTVGEWMVLSEKEKESGTASPSFSIGRKGRLDLSQLEDIRFLHENFLRMFSTSLAVSLGCPVSPESAEVGETIYGEFLETLGSRPCLLSLNIRAFQTPAVLAIDSQLASVILEFLLGSKRGGALMDREFTEIERNVLDLLFQIIIAEYQKAWSATAELEFQIDRLRQDPQALDAMDQKEPVVGVTVGLRIGDTAGVMRFALPSLYLQAVRGELAERHSQRAVAGSGAARERLEQLLAPVGLRLEARLHGATALFRNLAVLKPGDVVTLGYPIGKSLDCLVNGKPKFRGQILDVGSHIVFRIDGFSKPSC
jgi:flagellar motor switch protein FliM